MSVALFSFSARETSDDAIVLMMLRRVHRHVPSWLHLRLNGAPGFATVVGMKQLCQVVSVSRNRPAISAVHKVELDDVFTVDQVLLQGLSRPRRFPGVASVFRAKQSSLDGCGRSCAMRFVAPYPAFPGGYEAPDAAEFDRSGGLPTPAAVLGAVDHRAKTGGFTIRRVVFGK